MNNFIGLGRISKDIEVRYSQGDTQMAIAKFSVALNRKFKKEGEPTADFINCVAFGKTAEFIEKYFSKGKLICFAAHVQCGSYTNKDNQKVYTTDFVVDEVEFSESKNNNIQAGVSPHGSAPVDSDGFMQIPDGCEELPFQ